MNPTLFRNLKLTSLLTAAAIISPASWAADIIKANNASNLTDPASWVGGVVPTTADVGVWNATVGGANTTSLGADTNWAGVRIANPGGLVTVNSGNTLTLGRSGIDMSAASQDVTLNNNVTLGTLQNWTVASGRTLTLGNNFAKAAGAAVRFSFADLTSTVILTNPANLLLLNGTGPFGTVNDTDYAFLDSLKRVVGGVTLGTYTNNPASGTPTLTPNAITNVVDFTVDTGGSYGFRIGNAASVYGVRLNQPNTTVPNWRIDLPSGRTLTLNAFLIGPGVGNQQLQITGTGFIRIGSSGTQDLLIFQNNPSGSLVFQNTGGGITQQGTGALNKMGVGTVEIQVNATYTGGTRIYEGTLLVSLVGKVGQGPLTVLGGKLAGSSGSIINPSSTTFSSGATNAVQINAANGQFTITNQVTYNGTTYLEFNYANGIAPSTTNAALNVVGSVTNNGTINIYVNAGILPVGQYPLIKATNAITVGTLNLAASLPHTSAFLSNNTANSSIDLVVTANTQPLRWATGNGTWNIATTANWKDSVATTTTYQQLGQLADSVLFEDSQSGANPTVTLDTTVIPPSVTVDATKSYTITGTGNIAGIGSFTKTNSGLLTLSTANSFSGGMNINGGTLNFSALTNLGGGAISFRGGTLQYAAGNVDDISVRTVTFNAGGATIDTGINGVTYLNPIGNAGAGGLTKTGSGTLTLNGTNRYTGNTVVSQATLALGSANTYISNSAAIVVNSGTTLDAQLSGLDLGSAVSQALVGSGTVDGIVTATNGTRISPGTNGVVATLAFDLGSLTFNGGTLNIDISTNSHDMLTVNGNVTLSAGAFQFNATTVLTNGVYRLITYTGVLTGGAGSVGNIQISGVSPFGAALSAATPNEIDLIISDSASDSLTWSGSGANWDTIGSLNWLKGVSAWAFTNGDIVRFDESGAAVPAVQLQGVVSPASVTVSNPVTTYTLADGTGSGGGKISGPTGLVKDGAGTLIVDTANNYSGPTTVKAGTLQVGDFGSTGDIGTGNVTNNGALDFRQTDNRSVAGAISGTGTLMHEGATTLTLANNNTYSGVTTIGTSSSILQIGSGGATGSLGTGSVVNDGTLTFNRSGALTVTNPISGLGGVTYIGPATVTLVRTNTYLGNTTVSRGVLKLGAPDVIPDAVSASASGVLTVDGGAAFAGVFDLAGFNESVNALAGALGTVLSLVTNTSTSATTTNILTIGNDISNPTAAYLGLIQEATNGAKIGVLKLGIGNQTLAAPNNYSGGTIVGGGTLTLGAGGTAGQPGNTAAGAGSITMSNGTTVFLGGNSITFPANPIIITPNSIATFNSQVLGNAFAGPISGDANSSNVMGGPITGSGTGQWNAFPGTVVINLGAELRSSGVNNGGTNTIFDVEGTLHTRNADNFFVGALIGTGTIDNPTVAPPGTFLIGSKNLSTEYSGTFSGFNNVVKSGVARLALSGTNVSYTGNTTVSNGVLQFVVPANPSNSPNITLSSSTAILDAKSMGYVSNQVDEFDVITNSFNVTNGILVLNSNQVLTGIGTVDGKVVASAGSILRPGLPVGNLTVTSNLTLMGPIFMELNRTNAPNATNDSLTAGSFTVIGSVTDTVTNVGPDLVTGDTFKLFSSPVAGLTVNLPVSNALNTISYVWTNRVAIDGTIKVLSGAAPVNTTPTNITFTSTPTQLSLAWPLDHTGWRLQAQTNSNTTGISTNWVFVPGSDLTNQMTFLFNRSNVAVFYRLIYP